MTVLTLRPDQDVSITGAAVTGAATRWDATSDDDDASYFELDNNGDTAVLGFDEPTIPAGAVIKSIFVKLRGKKGGGDAPKLHVSISPDGSSFFGPSSQIITWTTPTTFIAENIIDLPLEVLAAGPFTAMQVNVNKVNNTGTATIYEEYIDVTYVAVPELTVDIPDTPTADTTPTFSWVPDLDPDANGQSAYQVRVFTTTQAGAVGFSPETDTPIVDSGVIEGNATSWAVDEPLDDDTYRVFVKIATDVRDERIWSDWTSPGGTAPTEPTYVAHGTMQDALAPSTLTIPFPAGVADDDFCLLVTYVKTPAGADPVTFPAGWDTVDVSSTSSAHGLAIASRYKQSGDSDPVVTMPAGMISPDMAIGVMFAFRDTDPVDAVGVLGAASSSSGAPVDLGPISGITPVVQNNIVFVLGARRDDAGSLGTLSGEGMTWTNVLDYQTTTGNDARMAADTGEGWVSGAIADKTWTISGGIGSNFRGIMMSIKGAAGVFNDVQVVADRPGLPALTVTPQSDMGRIRIEASATAGDAVPTLFQVQRSNDQENWEYVRTMGEDGTFEAGEGTGTVWDYEAGNGAPSYYRARAIAVDEEGGAAYSDWTSVIGTLWISDAFWLKVAATPGMNIGVTLRSQASKTEAARQGIMYPLGSSHPIVVSDARNAPAGELVVRCENEEQRDQLRDIVRLGVPVLVQFRRDDQAWEDRWVVFSDYIQDRALDSSWGRFTFDTVPWVEVARPDTLVEAWENPMSTNEDVVIIT